MTNLLTVCAPGILALATRRIPCALGRGGIQSIKREGDGVTPCGRYQLRRVFYRADRLKLPEALRLPRSIIRPEDGWCDDPRHPAYNRPIRFPFTASAERMWRDDGLYDVVVVLGHNDMPPVAGEGSAIFFHIARPDYAPTQGCVAISLADMIEVLAILGPAPVMDIRNE